MIFILAHHQTHGFVMSLRWQRCLLPEAISLQSEDRHTPRRTLGVRDDKKFSSSFFKNATE
jgi:hypothetical protein